MDAHVVMTVLWWCAKPSTLAPAAFVLGIGLLVYRRRIAGTAVLALSAFILLNATVLPTSELLAQALEHRAPPTAALPPTVDGIIVLGGDGAARLPPFAELAARYPTATLVFSGGSGEAKDARQVLSRFGDVAERTIFEERSRNTYENARFSHHLVQPATDETWVLVTSAIHMARAARVFEENGWAVSPYPVRTNNPDMGVTSVVNRFGHLDAAIREWFATLLFTGQHLPDFTKGSLRGVAALALGGNG